MTGRLESKVAVVTGGANGIGRACCERFAEEGADVVVADLLDTSEATAAVKTAGREALGFRLDATSADDNEAMVRAALERFGRLDVLVTAAGVSHARYVSGDLDTDREMVKEALERFGQPGAALLALEPDEWRRVLEINLTGTMLAVRAAAGSMIESGTRGSIVTLASIAAKRPDAGPMAYTASKAAVWMFTKAAARDLAPAGIRVNAIGPGFIDTNMTAAFGEFGFKDLLLTQIPMGRTGLPREVAEVALFLAGDESSYVTGEIIHPDGGFYTE